MILDRLQDSRGKDGGRASVMLTLSSVFEIGTWMVGVGALGQHQTSISGITLVDDAKDVLTRPGDIQI